MDIYRRKSHWKWLLAAFGLLVVAISLLYTRHLAKQLIERENQQAGQFAEAMRQLGRTDVDNNCDFSLPNKLIIENTTIPIVVLDEVYNIEMYRNIDGRNLDSLPIPHVRKRLNEMVSSGADTIVISFGDDVRKTLIYGHSNLLWLLNIYPILQFCLIAGFILLGYIGFSAARRAEQNQVWLGMAKETAHQLGTPITAILGWVETLRAVNEDNATTQDMLNELGNDVSRLELVADRFSKIGAQPELQPVNIYDQIEAGRAYMQRRAPRRTVFEFPNPTEQTPLMVRINPPLFDWVLENLLRNAIDAMEGGIGTISAHVYEESRYICFDISDTGKGIPSSKHKTVFKPGYSTKTRGWGLGLSLSKRIVQEYHGGKIFVKKSEPGKGTTFTVKLPK